jgi:hypothetical protein
MRVLVIECILNYKVYDIVEWQHYSCMVGWKGLEKQLQCLIDIFGMDYRPDEVNEFFSI